MPKVSKSDPDRNDLTVASNIRNFRIARKMSQTDLGAAVDVTFQQIQKYEKGKNACPPGRLRAICKALKVTPAEMFGKPPTLDGEPLPEISNWSYRTLRALNQVKSESQRRAISSLIQDLVGQ